jgi:hypothetical protein
MVGQQAYGWYAYSDEAYIYQATVQVKSRDTFAEVALSRTNFIDGGEDFWGEISIIQTKSASGTENFDPPHQALWRQKLTSITVQLTVISAFARGRLLLNYWS